jgi:ABC-type Na+ transport system ATPase subunit NatA
VQSVCDRMIILHHGEIVFAGEIADKSLEDLYLKCTTH